MPNKFENVFILSVMPFGRMVTKKGSRSEEAILGATLGISGAFSEQLSDLHCPLSALLPETAMDLSAPRHRIRNR